MGGTAGNPPSPIPPPPPPSPWAAGSRPERLRPCTPPEGPLHPGVGRHSRGERSRAPSAPGRPPAHSRTARCRPAALRQRRGPQQHGGARESADEAARLDARLRKAGEGAVERKPPLLPPPHSPTGGRPDRAWRPRPPRNPCIPRGGAPEKKGDRAEGHRPPPRTGERGTAARPPPPLSLPFPPRPAGHGGAGPNPTRGRGGIPRPPEGIVTPGVGSSWTPHAVHPRAPHCLPLRGSRQAGEPAPASKNGARATPGGGTRQRTGAVRGPRPHDPSVANNARNVAHQGRAEGRTEATRPPGPPPPSPPPRRGGSRAAPPPLPGWPAGARPHPAPGAAPRLQPNAYTWRGCDGDERGARQRAAGRPPQRGRRFEVRGLILRVLDAFRPRGATWLGQVISSPPGPSGGPSKTHLLPGGGVPRVHRARSPVLPRLPRFATPRSVHQFGRGGTIPPASGGGGRGPRGLRAGAGAGGGGVAPRPPCSPSGRRPAVLHPGPLRVAGAFPSGVRVRSGLKCRPGVGGGEGRPVDRSPGGLSRPEPPLCHPCVNCGYGRVMWGAASFLFCCARCSGTPVWVRGSRSSRRSPYRVAVPSGGWAPPRP